MYYIGWDIGIKNLAYCIIDENKLIKEFNIINLIDDPIVICCSCSNKNGKPCKSKASHYGGDIFYCNKHFLQTEPKQKKQIKKIKPPKKCNKYSLEEIGKRLFNELDNNPLFLECQNIIIENQPVLLNPTMKSIQIMLYSYFLIKNKNINSINLVNASNKLKVYKGKLEEDIDLKLKAIKDKYRRNKMTAIEHCRIMIIQPEKLDYFNSHKKKDDLADAFLMCHYLINKSS